MKRVLMMVLMPLLVGSPVLGQPADDLRVFISVDMEGIAGVTNWEEMGRGGKDYDLFRKIMTQEASAAVEGAVAAGAKEIWVRDSHGSARNILPDLLNRNAKLLRDWSGRPEAMMLGIDETFDAAIFIGYHAKAGTPDALLEHTFSNSRVTDIAINGVSLPEAGINALLAGLHEVPVVFVAGDEAVCEQVRGLFGKVETVAVKKGIGAAALNLHPEVAQEKIRAGVEKALGNLSEYEPYKMTAPYTMVLKLKNEELVYKGALYPGAKRTGDWEITYSNDDLLEVLQAIWGIIE